jgi:hypothetical protein
MTSADTTRSASPDAPAAAEARLRLVGILLMVLSTLVFACNNVLAKYLTQA